MISLEVKVPITVWKFDLWKNYRRNVPQKWNDLSRQQVIHISGLMVDESEPPVVRRLLITAALMRLPIWMVKMFSPVQMVQLQWYADFLYKENTLTKQLLPFVKVGWKRLYGPPDELKYVKAKEFIQVEKHFSKYYKTGEIGHLDKMIACMYRPHGKLKSNDPRHKDFCGDVREDFNANTIDERARLVSKLPLGEKMAVYNWYLGCWLRWQKIFRRVFSGGKKNSEHFGWPETMLNMSGEKFGTIDRAMEHYMFDILLQMEIEMKQHEEIKEKYGN